MNVGKEVRKAAIDKGVKLTDVAKGVHMKYPYFSARINGHRDFTANELTEIGDFLGLPGSEFMLRAEEAALAAQHNTESEVA